MMSEKMTKAINKQINAEIYSAYLYMSMSAYFTSINLPGFANWIHVQAKEEMTHAMRFFNHLNERNAKITFKGIDGPPTEWESPLAAFKDALAHEQKVTGMINDLVDLAIKDKDHASNAFLQWFVNEQVEEEANATDNVNKLKLVGKDTSGLFMADRELAARIFVPPVDMPGYISAI
jgi:ferritin